MHSAIYTVLLTCLCGSALAAPIGAPVTDVLDTVTQALPVTGAPGLLGPGLRLAKKDLVDGVTKTVSRPLSVEQLVQVLQSLPPQERDLTSLPVGNTGDLVKSLPVASLESVAKDLPLDSVTKDVPSLGSLRKRLLDGLPVDNLDSVTKDLPLDSVTKDLPLDSVTKDLPLDSVTKGVPSLGSLRKRLDGLPVDNLNLNAVTEPATHLLSDVALGEITKSVPIVGRTADVVDVNVDANVMADVDV